MASSWGSSWIGSWGASWGTVASLIYMLPDADSVDGGWTNDQDGTELYSAIAGIEPGDTDYIKSSIAPSVDICRIRLANPGAAAGEPGKLRYRFKKEGSTTLNLTVRLFEGAAEIAEWVHADVSSSYVTVLQTLTEVQFDAISDFDDLYIEFEADAA